MYLTGLHLLLNSHRLALLLLLLRSLSIRIPLLLRLLARHHLLPLARIPRPVHRNRIARLLAPRAIPLRHRHHHRHPGPRPRQQNSQRLLPLLLLLRPLSRLPPLRVPPL